MKKIIVTGGAGFIGSALIRRLVCSSEYQVLNIDKLTYAGNLKSLETISHFPNYEFLHADICNSDAMKSAFSAFQPNFIMGTLSLIKNM